MSRTDTFKGFQERLAHAEPMGRLVAECLLVVLLAFALARVVWLVAAPSQNVAKFVERPLPKMLGMASGDTGMVQADRSLLVKFNPFISDAPEFEPDAPETTLNLQLAGLRMTIEGPGSSAVIVTPNGMSGSYIVGDEVLPGVRLEHIRSDRVIISRDGVSETVMLSGRGDGLSVISDGAQVPPADATDNVETVPTGPVEGFVTDPGALFQLVSARPEERSGRLYGYRLVQIGTDEALAAAGLKNGDVLLEVNGTPVDRIKVNELIDEIGEDQVANLLIERNGNTQSVRLRFKE